MDNQKIANELLKVDREVASIDNWEDDLAEAIK